jgi:hypothetical protein
MKKLLKLVWRNIFYPLNLIVMKHAYPGIAKEKYVLLSELGSRFNLSFSSHLILGNKLVALDGVKRILLISEANNITNSPCLIELDAVKSVSLKKSYGSIRPGELRSRRFEDFLRRIDLQFEYGDKNKPIVLAFYDSKTNSIREIPMLEENAKRWQMILSKMASS